MSYKNINVDELASLVGGPLRLTALIVNRARQIIKKAPVLIETDIDDPVQIAFLELIQGKIKLSEGNTQLPPASESRKTEKSVQSSEKP